MFLEDLIKLPIEEIMLQEWWADIPKFDYYKASTYGKIYSKKSDRLLTPCLTTRMTKYLVVNLRKDGKNKTFTVHKLVALTFLGECPKNQEVRHLDGDGKNNKLDNLCYGTRLENAKDKVRHNRSLKGIPKLKGESHGMHKLKNEDILVIRELYLSKRYSQRDIAKIFDVSQRLIWNVINYKNWAHI